MRFEAGGHVDNRALLNPPTTILATEGDVHHQVEGPEALAALGRPPDHSETRDWVGEAWSPRFSVGNPRPVESAVKPPRRHTKARRSETAGLGTAARGANLYSSI